MEPYEQRSEYLSVAEVASKLGVSAPTVRRKIAEGEIPAAQLGGPGSSVRDPGHRARALARGPRHDARSPAVNRLGAFPKIAPARSWAAVRAGADENRNSTAAQSSLTPLGAITVCTHWDGCTNHSLDAWPFCAEHHQRVVEAGRERATGGPKGRAPLELRGGGSE